MMYRTITVALREFRQQIKQRGFWIRAFAVPVILIVITLVSEGFQTTSAEDAAPAGLTGEQLDITIGYVDRTGLITMIPEQIPDGIFRAYAAVDAAAGAMEAGEIGAYYVVEAEYVETGAVRRIGGELGLRPADVDLFEWVLLRNLYPDLGADRLARLREPLNDGPRFVSLNTDGEDGGAANTMLPFLVTIAVMVPLFTSGGLLFQSLTEEKSGRIMEILLVSLKPHQLLTGKLLGLGAVTLAQYLVWVLIGGAALVITGSTESGGASLLAGIDLTPQEVLLVVLYALGGFTLYAALMAGVGALSPNMESGKTGIFFLALPMMIPIYLGNAIAAAPHGGLATALSLIPFSSPVAMLIRMTAASVPDWQLGASLALLAITGAGMIWLMSRLFRVQTLLSGEAFSFKRMWAAIAGT
jgi:ABC-2 type transport system permease protein